jgi:hypothetical protein
VVQRQLFWLPERGTASAGKALIMLVYPPREEQKQTVLTSAVALLQQKSPFAVRRRFQPPAGPQTTALFPRWAPSPPVLCAFETVAPALVKGSHGERSLGVDTKLAAQGQAEEASSTRVHSNFKELRRQVTKVVNCVTQPVGEAEAAARRMFDGVRPASAAAGAVSHRFNCARAGGGIRDRLGEADRLRLLQPADAQWSPGFGDWAGACMS